MNNTTTEKNIFYLLSGHRAASMLARYAHSDPLKVRQAMLEES